MKKVAIFSALALISIIAWFLASPLFINETVDEALPTQAELMAMPDDIREQTIQTITARMASKPDHMMQEEMTMDSSPALIKQGTFTNADAIHQGSGKALIYQLNDGSYLLRLENFKVTNGPDLMVYLVKSANVSEAAQVTSSYINLGDLKGNIGNQNYRIPSDANIAEFNSVVIWCELFGVLFSPANLIAN